MIVDRTFVIVDRAIVCFEAV